ncbi:Kinesin-like protein KIF15 [Hondaea fermentalgiana]|uniref:Kinesin-like protein KIF15 n=1 Tax=Hondaea fermentalgiana TaxID=2315210 RepID=A0A2R5GJ69_9STRA|nr:Kinesin-like protein KIF15 [Hondaea fermentalgiana]|eukprot:GBG30932.1 Kinesin-like protein KIF15 [Hondaea fermentalgiana]
MTQGMAHNRRGWDRVADEGAAGSSVSGAASGQGSQGSHVQVFVRVRPSEIVSGQSDAIRRSGTPAVRQISSTIIGADPSASPANEEQRFVYDGVFDGKSTQEEVYAACGEPLVSEVVKGFNCTVLAYGQTGSGKTHTIFGPDLALEDPDSAMRGVLPRLLEDLFARFKTEAREHDKMEFLCKGGLVEIYNERVHDLLDGASDTNLQLRESMQRGVYVEGQSEVVFDTAQEALDTVRRGAEGRRVGATAMNRESSRSHTVFTLTLESRKPDADGVVVSRTSRVNIVDLAGSERQKLTKATDERLAEANFINKSLLCLGTVISSLAALADATGPSLRPHIKYRDSKLTFLLRDSLGGNSKTHMIANVNPSMHFIGETLSTLKFAQRAKRVRNKAKVNEDLASASLASLRAQVERLKAELAAAHANSSGPLRPLGSPTEHPEGDEPSSSAPQDEFALERVEQLLAHALASAEAARRRAEELTALVKSQSAAREQLTKALSSQKSLFKLKTGQVAQLVKDRTELAAQTLEKWQAHETQLGRIFLDVNPEAVDWRTKFEELRTTRRIDEARLDAVKETEAMNRQLGKEIKVLLESKRELQDLLASRPLQPISETGFPSPTNSVRSGGARKSLEAPLQAATPPGPGAKFDDDSARPPLVPPSSRPTAVGAGAMGGASSSGISISSNASVTSSSTPARVMSTRRRESGGSAGSVCPTPTPADLERAELSMLQDQKRRALSSLDEQHREEELEKLREETATLREEHKEIETKFAAAETALAEARAANEQLKHAEAAANKEIMALEERVSEAMSQRLALEKAREDLENLQAQHAVTERALADLQKLAKEEKEQLEAELADAKQTVENLAQSHSQHAAEAEEQEQQQQILQEEVEQLTQLREAQQATDRLRMAKLKSDLAEAETREQEASQKNSELEQAILQFRESLRKERARAEEAEAECERLAADKADVEQTAQNEAAQSEVLRANLSEAKSELAQVEEAQRARERHLIAELASQYARLKLGDADEHSRSQDGQHELVDEEDAIKHTEEDEHQLRLESEARVVELQLKVEELSAANAKLAGNTNAKQRIRYVQGLRDEIQRLRENDDRLRKKLRAFEHNATTTHNVVPGATCAAAAEEPPIAKASEDVSAAYIRELESQITDLHAVRDREAERAERLEVELEQRNAAFKSLSEKSMHLKNLIEQIKERRPEALDLSRPVVGNNLIAAADFGGDGNEAEVQILLLEQACAERDALRREKEAWEAERKQLLQSSASVVDENCPQQV